MFSSGKSEDNGLEIGSSLKDDSTIGETNGTDSAEPPQALFHAIADYFSESGVTFEEVQQR